MSCRIKIVVTVCIISENVGPQNSTERRIPIYFNIVQPLLLKNGDEALPSIILTGRGL